MDAGQVALAAVVASVIGPLLLASLTNRNRRQEKREDYARQDAVAKQAAVAAELLLQRQDQAEERQRAVAAQAAHAAALLVASNEQIREQSERAFNQTQSQLFQIHALVNSQLTEAQRRERDATRAMLATMKEVVTLKQGHGIDPSPETLAAMREIEERIDILTQALDHKDEQAAIRGGSY